MSRPVTHVFAAAVRSDCFDQVPASLPRVTNAAAQEIEILAQIETVNILATVGTTQSDAATVDSKKTGKPVAEKARRILARIGEPHA